MVVNDIRIRFTKPGSVRFSKYFICVFFGLIATVNSYATGQTKPVNPIIENERVKVWDITLNPGQPTRVEHDGNDFITMFLVEGKIRTTYGSGKASVALRRFGDAIYGSKGTDEEDEVISGSPARLVVVELKDNPGPRYVNKSGYPAAFPRPGSRKVFENDRIVVWNYTWVPNVPTPTHYHDKDVVVVFRYDGSLKSTTPDGKSVVNDYKFGSILFNRGDRVHFEELVRGRQSAMMLELK